LKPSSEELSSVVPRADEPRTFAVDLEPSADGSGEQGKAKAGPPWTPSDSDILQARRRVADWLFAMPHDRVTQLSAHFVQPGQVPWWWWTLALLWIAVWPAAIALSLGEVLQLPGWAMGLGALLHLALLYVPVLLTERVASRSDLRRSFGRVRTLAHMLALEPSQFEAWTALLFVLQGYDVCGTAEGGDHGIDLRVRSPELPLGIVQCKRYRGPIGEPIVRDLYGAMIHEGAGFGWLITTGAVSRQARLWAEGKPIDLWDGPALLAQAHRLRKDG
jgi:hypothetical protein